MTKHETSLPEEKNHNLDSIGVDTTTAVEGWKVTGHGLQHAIFANPAEREEFGYIDAETLQKLREDAQ